MRPIRFAIAALIALAAARPAQADDPPPGAGPWVVRAVYKDERSLAMLMRRAAPWRVDHRAREVQIEVDNAFEWRRMEREGFEVRLDAGITRALRNPPAKAADHVTGIPGYACYRTVEETYAAAEAMVAARPTLAEWIDIGDSWRKQQNLPGGWDLRVLRITNRAIAGPKPVLYVQGALHAREYVTAETVLRFGEQLLGAYGSDPDATWIIDHHDVHLLPVANPDGRKVAEVASTRLQRKNRNESFCPAIATGTGVDLNRNYAWNFAGPGSSADPCDQVFRGLSSLSEPETQSITAWLRNIFPDQRVESSLTDRTTPVSLNATGFYIDVHSNGAGNWFPWGDVSTPAPNGTQMQTLARKLEFFNGYEAIQGALTGSIGGASDDYTFGTLGVPAFTMELGGSDFWPPCATYESQIAPGTLASLRFAARIVRAPYRLPAGPELVSLAATPAEVPPGGSTLLTATASDARFGPGTGPEPVQAVQAVEVFLQPPWAAGASPVGSMSAVDGAYDGSEEAVSFSLPAALLPGGRTLVYLQAIDAAGTRGPVSAVFVSTEGGVFADGFEPAPP
jgi:predicted deacylase